jgi:hypothetical protein
MWNTYLTFCVRMMACVRSVKELGSHGEQTYNLTDASVSDLSSWLEEVSRRPTSPAACFTLLYIKEYDENRGRRGDMSLS